MKIQYLFPFCLLLLISCTEKVLKDECPDLICTMEFRSVYVKFKNAEGNPITVKDFSAIIKRTGESTKPGEIDPINFKGIYAVVTDNDTRALLPKGDTIDVSAFHPQTNEKKTAQFVVKGGKCACHIEKVSGPEEIIFN